MRNTRESIWRPAWSEPVKADEPKGQEPATVSTVTVIVQGGMVRDVIGADGFETLDLDWMEGSSFTTVEEAEAELEHAEGLLPDDYPDRDGILADVRKAVEDVRAWAEWRASQA